MKKPEKEKEQVSTKADEEKEQVFTKADEEKEQVSTKADEENEQASTKADEENKQVSTKADEENEQASTKADEEKEQVSTKADEENEQASTKADEEKEQVSTKADEENEQASTKADEENEQASTKADEEKEQASTKADEENEQASTKADEEKEQVSTKADEDLKQSSSCSISVSYRLRQKRKHNYSLLQEEDEENIELSSLTKSRKLTPYQKMLLKHKEANTLEQLREKQKERNQDYLRNRTEERKQHDNKLQAIRQSNYRQREKLRQIEMGQTRLSAEKVKLEIAQKKEVRNVYMREWRNKNREALNQRRRELYRKRKAATLTPQKAEKVVSTANASTSTIEEMHTPTKKLSGSPFNSAEAKRKAISRSRQADPQDPHKYASIMAHKIKRAMTSPRKRAAFEKEGIIPQNSKFLGSFQRHLTELKKSRSKAKNQERRQLVAILTRGSEGNTSTLSKILDQRWHFVASASMLTDEKEEVDKVRHGNALSTDVYEEITDFFTRPDNSIVIPDRKMVRKDLVPRSCLLGSLDSLHKQYLAESGNQVSLSAFKRLRPQHSMTVDKLKRTSCLCKMCANIAQKAKVIKPLLRSKGIDFPENATELLKKTVCSLEQITPLHACMDRTCPDCGVETVVSLLKSLPQDQPVSWLRWQMCDSSTGSRIGNITKQGTVQELSNELITELQPLAKHILVAKWQYKQFRLLRNDIQRGEVLTLMDFAENYRCEYQQEVQSAHWSYTQATVFPTVNYYRCTCGELVTDSVIIISNDTQHDASAVHAFNTAVLEHLRGRRGLQLEKQYQFTDGAAAQFKSREPFMDICMAAEDHGILIERSFFGSSHGKGPCDGVGGVVKKAARDAVISEKAMIRDAAEMYGYLSRNLTMPKSAPAETSECCHNKRDFLFVADVNRKRSSRRPKNPLPGTQKVHCVRHFGPKEIQHRKLSCYCEPCQQGHACESVDTWRTHTFTVPSCSTSKPDASSDSTSVEAGNHQQAPEKSLVRTPPDTKETLNELQKCRNFEEFLVVAKRVGASLSNLPSATCLSSKGFNLDQMSKTLYPTDGPPHLVPVAIYGDGNCLARCASMLAYGHENKHLEMRLRIVVELATNKEHYLSPAMSKEVADMPKLCAQYSGSYVMQVLTPSIINEIFDKEVMECAKQATYMSVWQLYAVSSVLGTPILSIYPDYGGFTVKPHLHHQVQPRRPSTTKEATTAIMWTHTRGKELPAQAWTPNHFVVCLPQDVNNSTKNVKVGDFILMDVQSDRDGTSAQYVAIVHRLDADGQPWGVYLKMVTKDVWKLPEEVNPREYIFPVHTIIRILPEYSIEMDGRSLVYRF